MSRKLLLIYDPRLQQNDGSLIAGIKETHNKYKTLFNRCELGGWEEYETETMPLNLTGRNEVEWLDSRIREMNSDHYDYSIIVYVGHGGIEDGIEMVELPSGQHYPISNFLYGLADNNNRGHIKRTVIIDACRTLVQGQPQQVTVRLNEGQNPDLIRTYCKDYYNSLIEHADSHIELIQSTSVGQYAQGIRLPNGAFGGFVFSNALFSTLENNVNNWNNSVIGLIPQQDYKNNGELVARASELMTPFNQMPQITSLYSDGSGERDVSTFPFYAVRRSNL